MGAVSNSAACVTSATAFVKCLSEVVINPLLALIFAVGLLVFVYGIVEYLWSLSRGEGNKNEGKQHMLWGLIGMFVMAAAYAIIKFVASSINVPIPH